LALRGARMPARGGLEDANMAGKGEKRRWLLEPRAMSKPRFKLQAPGSRGSAFGLRDCRKKRQPRSLDLCAIWIFAPRHRRHPQTRRSSAEVRETAWSFSEPQHIEPYFV